MAEYNYEKRFNDAFKTINATADYLGIPRTMLRRAQKLGKVPGFYSGNRFYCNVDLIVKKLERDAGSVLSSDYDLFIE